MTKKALSKEKKCENDKNGKQIIVKDINKGKYTLGIVFSVKFGIYTRKNSIIHLYILINFIFNFLKKCIFFL